MQKCYVLAEEVEAAVALRLALVEAEQADLFTQPQRFFQLELLQSP
jgi:hypothetical protein